MGSSSLCKQPLVFFLVYVWESISLMVHVLQNTSQMLPVAFLLPALQRTEFQNLLFHAQCCK